MCRSSHCLRSSRCSCLGLWSVCCPATENLQLSVTLPVVHLGRLAVRRAMVRPKIIAVFRIKPAPKEIRWCFQSFSEIWYGYSTHWFYMILPHQTFHTTKICFFLMFCDVFLMLETRDQTGVKLVGFFTYSKVVTCGDWNHGILWLSIQLGIEKIIQTYPNWLKKLHHFSGGLVAQPPISKSKLTMEY